MQNNGNGNGNDEQRAAIRPTSAPPVDVYENDDEILVVADMPGARSDSVTVKLDKDELYISAVREGDGATASCWPAGGGTASTGARFLIPRGVDPNGISAEMSQGVLKVHLPKTADVKPRVIQVKTVN